MQFSEFASAVEGAGLQAIHCSATHWRIVGGRFAVNFYPTTRNGPTYYVNGTTGGRRGGVGAAIAAANIDIQIETQDRKGKRKKSYRKEKRRLWNVPGVKRCFYCRKPIENLDDATVEHLIPLSRGGTNGVDNLALSHQHCNNQRGDSLEGIERAKNNPS